MDRTWTCSQDSDGAWRLDTGYETRWFADDGAGIHEGLVRGLAERHNTEVADLRAKLEQAEQDRERAEMQLAACTVAALGNTPESVAERIAPGHPCYSASYGDVCRAVDREMSLRAKLEQAERQHECDRCRRLRLILERIDQEKG